MNVTGLAVLDRAPDRPRLRTLSLTEAAALLRMHPEKYVAARTAARSREPSLVVAGFSSKANLPSTCVRPTLLLGKRCE